MTTLPATRTLSLISRLNVYRTPPSSPIFQFPRSRFFLTPPPTPLSIMASATQPSSYSKAISPDDVTNETNVFQLIQAHQEKAARLSPVEEIRTVLDRSRRGMLSTFSQKHEGYPSGSMVDFACDANGSPILAVSSLAVHTKDLLANCKCSLLVARDPEDRTDLVITLHGDAIAVSEKDQAAIRTAYLAKHPNAFWVDFGDFQFMRIEPKVVRYVSGVATALLGSGEFGKEEYQNSKVDLIAQFSKPVATQKLLCNSQHQSRLLQVDSAYMLDLDSLGFNVKASYQGNTFKLRVPFPRRAEDRNRYASSCLISSQLMVPQKDLVLQKH
ncbi:hypothetical protein V6N13_088594 [Hibiscus sabdariffa]